MYAKELKIANGRKPGKDKDVSTPHCIYDNDPFLVGQIEDKDMLYKMSIELPETYNPPPIDDCVNDFGILKSAELMKAVNSAADHIVKDSAAAGLNRENVKSLNLYSFDYKPASKGLFGAKDSKDESEDNTVRKRLNDMLKERNPFTVVKGRGYLVSFLTSLRKLPHMEKFAFYCGVKEKLTNTTKFKYGSLLSCKHFLSCSTDPDSIKEMLNYTGTLFIIRGDPWAYDLRPFSFYPNEQEYLFEFGSQFKVTKVINGPINTIEMALNRVQNYDLTKLVPIPGYTYESPDAKKASQQPAQPAQQPQISSPKVAPEPPQVQPQPQQPQQLPRVQPQPQQPQQVPPQMQIQTPQSQPPQVKTQVQMVQQQQQQYSQQQMQQQQQYQMQQQYSQQQYQMQQQQQYSQQQQQQPSPQQKAQGQKSYQQYIQQQQYLGYVQNVVPHAPSRPNPPNVYASAALGAFAVNAARTFANAPNRGQPPAGAPANVPPQAPARPPIPQRQRPVVPAVSTASMQQRPPAQNMHPNPGQYPQQQNRNQMYPSQQAQAHAPGNNLVASKSVFKIQPKLVSRASLNIKRDGTVSSRISEAVAKIRDPSLRFYVDGCDELATIIFENNNKSTKETCMRIKVADVIFGTLLSKVDDRDICLASFNVLALLSDEAAGEIVESGCLETLANVTERYPNDAAICGLWCGIILNLFKSYKPFHDEMIDPQASESFETLKAVYKTHSRDPQVCDAMGQIIMEFSNDGYFVESRKPLAAELLTLLLTSLSADTSLSHSVCPPMAELLSFLGAGLDVNSYALLVAATQARAGFLDDLLPALTVLMRASEMKDPSLIAHASELGIGQVVVTLLHNYAEDSAVVDVCLALASNVLTNNNTLYPEFVQLGFVELAVASIRKHGASAPSICTRGLDALLVLSMNPSAIQAFISSNGTPLLFEIMQSPIASELIMQNVWGICSWIASNNSSIVLAAAGGGNVILGLFETYIRDKICTERGSVTLMYLAQSCPEMSSVITTPQAISLFANVLGTYMDNQAVCVQMAFLFSKIVDILDGSGIENCLYQLLSIAYRHSENKTIVECVCATLKRIALSDIKYSRSPSALSSSNWASSLGEVLEKNGNTPDICRCVIDALATLTRIQDPANFRSLLTHVRTFVVVFGNNSSDLAIAQCASELLKNIIPSENALQILAGTTETIPAIKAVLDASGQDKVVFLNCSYVLKVLVESVVQLYQSFVQFGCATTYYNLYAMFKTSDPATAAEGSWIEKYISH